ADGTKITETEVSQLAQLVAILNGSSFDDLPDNQKQELKNSVTIFCVERTLVKNAVKGKDVITSSAKSEIDQQIEQIKGSEAATQLNQANIREAVIRDYLESSYYYQAYFTKVTEEDDPVTEEEIQTYYDENLAQFVSPPSITVSHILVSDAAISDEGRAKAEDIRKKAMDGEDFAKLAAEYSVDTGSKDSGGEIGYVDQNSSYVPEFIEGSLSLKKKGDISEVVQSSHGYHIIKADSDLVPEEQLPVTDQSVQDYIKQVIGEEHTSKALEQLKEDSDIKYNIEVDPETGEPPTTIPEETPEAVEEGAGLESEGGTVEGLPEGADTEEGTPEGAAEEGTPDGAGTEEGTPEGGAPEGEPAEGDAG
ncbi:MAG: peptidylprolyl isomerase, partial [Clostridiales Family XIII bacterium]|nr:peptidylprolyl isomerase [Clostridiales Family XIII bacterium]